MSEYKSTFIVIPTHVWELPDITLRLLKFYEKIFQFLHKGLECRCGNDYLKEAAGFKSDSSISEAFAYFEKNNIIKRIYIDGKRYIIAANSRVEIEQEVSLKRDAGLAVARGGSRSTERGGLAVAIHNDIKINDKSNNNKRLIKDWPSNEGKQSNEQELIIYDNKNVDEKIYNEVMPKVKSGEVYTIVPNGLMESTQTPKPKRSVKTDIPSDFCPTEEHRGLACTLKVDIYEELDKFRDYYLAHGKKMINWDATFRNWLRNAAKFVKHGNYQEKKISKREEMHNNVMAICGDAIPAVCNSMDDFWGFKMPSN